MCGLGRAGTVTRGHEPARGKRGAASVSTVISASVGGHEPACGARGAAPVSPQFSRPPGRSSLGRAEAGRPGARGRTSRVSPIFAAGGALTGRRPELVQDSDLAGPHGPAPGLRHPEPGPAGAGRSPGHCTSHELRFMLTRVAPLGHQTTVRAPPCWPGRYKPLESLQTHPTRALFARSDPAVAHIFSVPRPAPRSVLQNYRGPSQHIHFVRISLFARPVFAVRVPLVCAASLYPRGSVRSTFGQCLLPCAISVCHLLSTRIGLVSFWSVKNLCEQRLFSSSAHAFLARAMAVPASETSTFNTRLYADSERTFPDSDAEVIIALKSYDAAFKSSRVKSVCCFFQKLKSAAQRGWTSLPAWFGRIVISKIWRLLSWIFPSTNCAVWPLPSNWITIMTPSAIIGLTWCLANG